MSEKFRINPVITKIKMTKIVITQFLYADILLHHTLVQKNVAEALNIASHLCQYHLLLIDHPIDSCQNPLSKKIIIWLGSKIGILSDTGYQCSIPNLQCTTLD